MVMPVENQLFEKFVLSLIQVSYDDVEPWYG